MPTSQEGEKRRRRKHHRPDEQDSTTSSRDKARSSHSAHKSSSSVKLPLRKKRSASRERDRERDSHTSRKTSMAVPEMDRRSSSGETSRSANSYPTFSKAHSREAVGARDGVEPENPDPPTPDATELSNEKRPKSSTPAHPPPTRAPPSPPLTADDPEPRRSGSSRSKRSSVEDVRSKTGSSRRSADISHRSSAMKNAKSGASLRRGYGESDLSSMPGGCPEEERKSTPNSSHRRTVSAASRPHSTLTEETTHSDTTSIAPNRKSDRPQPHVDTRNEYSTSSSTDSQPRTPTQENVVSSPRVRATPVIDVGAPQTDRARSFATPPTAKQMAPPPPPPPPMASSKEPPRVDYLLKHGGLPHPVPKRLVQTGPSTVQPYNFYQSPAIGYTAPLEEYQKVFTSIHNRLDDYLQVLRGNGSLAVATGYKSVARRLLDKLSQIFARDISSQRCDCVVCRTTPQPTLSDEEDSGISWGEILEFVAGRRELPQWPPFSIEADDGGLGISGAAQTPMQKLDIDVPEEYRDHYIRQNQKTKRAVQSWLSQQPDYPSSPPEEADEDTLMFAMMTKLNPQQRNVFIALMHGQNIVSASRAPTPAERPTTSSTALRRAKSALQRLYRLDHEPRDCEAAIYLLHNPHMHGMLATLAEVNEAEWDILISGRFDGFLWSGAEPAFPPSMSAYGSPAASRGPSRNQAHTPFSRNTTPFSGLSGMPSRGPTPCDGDQPPSVFPIRGPTPGPGMGIVPPAPVQLDEDTEIAVAAEIERNLFMDMERLEDAFEVLHGRAEMVRQMLRERSAGLAAQAQARRGSFDPVGVRLDTPASGITDIEDGDDDGLGDLESIAPDDSASQISSNRRHRHRKERRTPAPEMVPEEDESVFEEEEQERSKKEKSASRSGRRSKY